MKKIVTNKSSSFTITVKLATACVNRPNFLVEQVQLIRGFIAVSCFLENWKTCPTEVFLVSTVFERRKQGTVNSQ